MRWELRHIEVASPDQRLARAEHHCHRHGDGRSTIESGACECSHGALHAGERDSAQEGIADSAHSAGRVGQGLPPAEQQAVPSAVAAVPRSPQSGRHQRLVHRPFDDVRYMPGSGLLCLRQRRASAESRQVDSDDVELAGTLLDDRMPHLPPVPDAVQQQHRLPASPPLVAETGQGGHVGAGDVSTSQQAADAAAAAAHRLTSTAMSSPATKGPPWVA